MTDARTYLAGIKERAEAATAGPWVHNTIGRCCDGTCIDSRSAAVQHDMEEIDWHDAEFIAHSRTDLPKVADALLAMLDLHQPVDAAMYSGSRQHLVQVCTGCGTDDGNWQRYPCPTAAAIEKALGGME